MCAEGWDLGGGLRSAAVVVEREEEEGEGECSVTGRRWKDIAVDMDGRGGGEGIIYARESMTETDSMIDGEGGELREARV